MKSLVKCALLVLLPATASAQERNAAQWADSVRVLIDRSFTAGDKTGLANAAALAERALRTVPDDGMLLFYQGLALFRQSSRGGDPAVLERAVSLFEKSLQQKQLPEAMALMASAYGGIIASDAPRAQELGPRAAQLLNSAKAAGSANPRVWLIGGIRSYYTPEQWGGGLAAAEEHVRKAIKLFETDRPAAPLPSWGRAEAHAWLGSVLQAQGRRDDARVEYAKALELEPGFAWVRYTLLPGIK